MEQFMKELRELCERHGLTINWDEYREEFCIEKINDYNLHYLLCAYDNIVEE
jgi:glutamate-1-semialdehyde aminotransferase